MAKIKAVAVLNEKNPEFFIELLKKGVDAVEPEMKKQLKRLMTDVAKGKISEKEADILIKSKKVSQKRPVGQIKGNTRKRSIKAGGNK